MDSEEVNRILDNLRLQGNAEELDNWYRVNVCWKCFYRLSVNELNEELKKQ